MFLHGSCVDASEAVTDDVNADRSRVKCEAYRQDSSLTPPPGLTPQLYMFTPYRQVPYLEHISTRHKLPYFFYFIFWDHKAH